ncbi:MAG: hypothetical protein LBS88_08985 [Tannerellaceae bacterium]|jgi:hypothetical protein|nr:hypothetical protein [Tannerellaceae bacterium]
MRYLPVFLLVWGLLPISAMSFAQEGPDDWVYKTLLLTYSPRYFGPTAFPIPELGSGKSPSQYEIEVRGQYHYYTGDQTKDVFLRALLPVIKGRAGIEISFIAAEEYKLTPETRDERNAVDTVCVPWVSYTGDVVISAFYQLWRSEEWMDLMFSLNLKTASGGRLCDARFTDAATYWIDITAGKDLLKSKDGKYALRAQAMAGFYCWMTNDILLHRQNDAILYGLGLKGSLHRFSLSSDLSGFSGYENNGDHPLLWRNNLRFEYRNNILSLRYVHGMQDSLYDTYSVGYIRKF